MGIARLQTLGCHFLPPRPRGGNRRTGIRALGKVWKRGNPSPPRPSPAASFGSSLN